MASQDDRVSQQDENGDAEVLAYLQRRGIPSPMAQTLNFRLTVAETGRIVFRGTPLDTHANAERGTHGGWYGSILDSAMTSSLLTQLSENQGYATLDYGVRMTRAIPLGTEVLCEGTAQHLGRRTAVARGEIRDDSGRLYATGTTTCLILPKRQE